MAQKRMFDRTIVRTDAFIEMPSSTQNLYFHLGMESDDEGFVSPKMIMRSINSSEDDLKLLIAKHFVIPFESGAIVITHFNQNNYLSRKQPTKFTYEKGLLVLTETGSYELNICSTNVLLEEKKRREERRKEVSAPQADAAPFVLEEKLESMESKPGSHLDVIASFIREKNLKPQSSAELTALIKRHARMAAQLTAFMEPTDYPMRRVFKAMEKCSEEGKRLNYDWSLETVLKKLTQ